MTPDWAELGLDDALIKVLLANQLNKPTKVQQQALPVALDGRDLLLSAPTGTGKTLAFLLPALQHMLDFPRRKPGAARVLVLTPTRELAEQIGGQAKQFEQSSGLRSVVITGGINYGSQLSQLEQGHELVIATPGRLADLLGAEQYHLDDVEWLIIDEADRMLDMGFRSVVDDIATATRSRQQSILVSATLDSEGVAQFAKRILNEPEAIDVHPPRRERGKIQQLMYQADTLEHKQQLLLRLLGEHQGRRLVFVRTRERVEQLAGHLRREYQDDHVLTLRGDMPQADRQQIINRLQQDKDAILVATDVAARGLDIDDVSLVVNFDLPKSADVYIHRIGRTARGGKKGLAIALVEAHDALLLGRIERYQGEKIERRVIDDLRPQYKFPATQKTRKKSKKKVPKKPKKSRR